MSLMPRPTAPMVGPGGVPTREWLDYLRGLAGTGDLAGVVKAIERLQQQVVEIERTPAVAGEVQGIGAVRALGLLADGLVRLDLRELEDAGGGELVKILRDSYGRVAGSSRANTDDLPEGMNLYFTEQRVDERIAAVGNAGEVIVGDGVSPPVMLSDDAETDFLHQG